MIYEKKLNLNEIITIDVCDDDIPTLCVLKTVRHGCQGVFELVNKFTGDEAIELYKKLVGG